MLIDFTPDTIANEYAVGDFASLFDGSPLSQSNQFLNYDASDVTIDSDDAIIAASRIASKVRQHLLTFERDPTIDLKVLYTPDLLSPTDPGTGEIWLQNGQQASQENTYVIYVGADRPSTAIPKLGIAHQAYEGHNNEFYGFAFAGGVADLLSSGNFRWKHPSQLSPIDFTNSVAFAITHELGHLWGLGHVADSAVFPGEIQSPDNYHHVMNTLSRADPATARLLNDSTHEMVVGNAVTQDTSFKRINADQEVRQSLRTDGSNNFLQTTVPNSTASTVPTYQQAYGAGLEDGTEPGPPAPRSDAPAASMGTLGSLSPADIATQFDTGFDTLATDVLADFANRMNFAAGSIPLVAGNFSEMLRLTAALQASVSTLDVDLATTMDALSSQLASAGFVIEQVVTDAQFGSLPSDQPADLIRASRTHSLAELVHSTALSSTGLSSIGDLVGINFSGNLDILADVFFTVSAGVDTGGFYLLPGNGLTGRFAVGGNIGANFGVLSRADGAASVAFDRTVQLTNPRAGQAGDDGRIRIADLTASFGSASEVNVQGSAGINLDVEVTPGGMKAIEFAGRWIWDLAANGSGFTFDSTNSGLDQDSVDNSLINSVGELLSDLAMQSSTIVDQATKQIPLIGDAIRDELSPLLAEQIGYDNQIGLGRLYLESRGFQFQSIASASDLIRGNYSSGGDLLRVSYSSDAVAEIDPLLASGSIDFSNQGVPIELSLSGTIDVDPNVGIGMQFGIDWFNGPYIVEGASWNATLMTDATLVGSIDLGDLEAVTANATATIDVDASFVFSDGDNQQNEKLFWDDFSVGTLVLDTPDIAEAVGDIELDLDLSVNTGSIPIIEDFLNDVFSWRADATYSFDGTGTFVVDENSITSVSSLLAGIEPQLKTEFLGLVDEFNPLPQGLRDFLTLEIELLGDQSILDLLGLGEAEILINPLGAANQTNSGSEEHPDHVLLNFDIADPQNVLALLSGQPADLFSLDIEKSFGPTGLSFPIVQNLLLASYFGGLNAFLDIEGAIGMGLTFDVVVGLDTSGFYLRDDADILAEVTGRISADPTIKLALATVDFARIKGSIGISATGGIDVQNPNGSSAKIRAGDLFLNGSLNTNLIDPSLAFDLDWSLYGELGKGAQTSTTDTYEDSVRLYEFSFGGGQPRSDALDELSDDMERRVDQLLWCGAATNLPSPVTIAGCAYYSLPDLQELGQQALDYGN